METRCGRGRPKKGNEVRRPHFFKIMIAPTLRDGGLRIPKRYVRKFGHRLSSPVKLQAPGGGFWPVELVTRGHEMWLGDGWKKFVEFHSIAFGYLLVFRYEGKPNFLVLIFDMSATEVDYPKVLPWKFYCPRRRFFFPRRSFEKKSLLLYSWVNPQANLNFK